MDEKSDTYSNDMTAAMGAGMRYIYVSNSWLLIYVILFNHGLSNCTNLFVVVFEQF